MIPVGYTILVKLDEIKKSHKVEGTNIELALATDEKLEKHSEQRGTLIAIGELAWRDCVKIDGEPVGKPWAKPGDKVIFSKYAGKFLPGSEWKDYMLMQDQDVVAIIDGELK